MSHYAVAVFSDDGDFDQLLEKYNECNDKYFVFKPADDVRESYERFKLNNPESDYTFRDFVAAFNYILVDGQYGHMVNPHGYWDWYTLDGKDFLFDLKPEATLEEFSSDYRKNDYDWYPDNRCDAKDAEEFWDEYIAKTDVEVPGLYTRNYYLERYRTKEQFVKEESRTIPYAFITPDGQWHSAGVVGFFGLSDETAESANKYAEEWDAWIQSEANPYVNLVDCHI